MQQLLILNLQILLVPHPRPPPFHVDSVASVPRLFYNKSTYANGDANYHASIPVFANTSTNVTVVIVLQGRPIVAAGGVVMRLAKEGDDSQNVYDMDFPMLTGEP